MYWRENARRCQRFADFQALHAIVMQGRNLEPAAQPCLTDAAVIRDPAGSRAQFVGRDLEMRNLAFVVSVMLAAAALAGCASESKVALADAQSPKKSSLTRSDAAKQCWMATEKGRKDMPLDKRADVVTKCIDDKLNAAEASPAG